MPVVLSRHLDDAAPFLDVGGAVDGLEARNRSEPSPTATRMGEERRQELAVLGAAVGARAQARDVVHLEPTTCEYMRRSPGTPSATSARWLRLPRLRMTKTRTRMAHRSVGLAREMASRDCG
jgi:hypothetical protein